MKIVSLHWSKTIPIRHRVLWPDKPPEFCHIEGDENALHFGAFLSDSTEDGFLASVASIYIDGESARLRKFATLPEFQGQGIGSALLAHIITTIKEKGVAHFWCDARATATGFYARFGLEEEGEIFTKSGLPYRKMSIYFGASHSLQNG